MALFISCDRCHTGSLVFTSKIGFHFVKTFAITVIVVRATDFKNLILKVQFCL